MNKNNRMTGKGNMNAGFNHIPAWIPRINGIESLKKGYRWRISFLVTKSLFET